MHRRRLVFGLVALLFVATVSAAPQAQAAPFGRWARRVGSAFKLRRRAPRKPVNRELRALFRAVPKTELHMHLGGSTPLGMLRKFRVEEGKNPLKVMWKTRIKRSFRSLNDFLATYYRVAIIKDVKQVERAAEALVKEVAKENVRYCEIRSSINYKKNVSAKDMAAAIQRGMKRGAKWVKKNKGWDMGLAMVVLAQRAGTPEKSLEAAKLAVELSKQPGSLIRGFDLAGSESDHAVTKHARALSYFSQHGKPLGLGLTVHAGEVKKSEHLDGVDSVRHAVRLGADRIGHGLRALEDKKLIKEIRAKGIHIELNPWSNVQLGNVDGGYPKYPLRQFLKAGVSTSLSTDNRTISRIDLSKQLGQLYKHGQVRSWSEIKKLTLDGISAGFATPQERARVRGDVQREFERIERDPQHRATIAKFLTP